MDGRLLGHGRRGWADIGFLSQSADCWVLVFLAVVGSWVKS